MAIEARRSFSATSIISLEGVLFSQIAQANCSMAISTMVCVTNKLLSS